jgi:hypothetical protein
MASPLDALTNLSGLNASDPHGVVAARLKKEQALLEMKRSLELQAGDPTHTFSGATHADVADEENHLAESPDFGTDAMKRTADVQNTSDEMSTYNRPDVTAKRKEDLAGKLALASAPAEVAAKGNLAVENAKTEGALREKAASTEATQKLLEAIGGGSSGSHSGGLAGPGGTIKPTINASGGVSFTTTAMPALVQRARNQLMDARDKTLQALDEAEKQYPGIFEEATRADEEPAGGSALGRLFKGVTGIGADKYGGPAARAGAGIERANYTLGIPTPFSKLAQEASFGNIEQMAGQLPGVRGLATITPLFKEHQSRWGHETPTATVQRLKHMAELMNGTLHTLDTSGAGPE